ncbi:hypothetical protein J2Z31_005496 [Sinorhizobium kostiense]|uniref:Uncharacterized protein n=1 Tax=Sinorhizobium kostiense TaxID=76747 RepID=A0ABS4R7T2_9HYPH|nr:hypothetical protein [Sinorhizobium kostiense]
MKRLRGCRWTARTSRTPRQRHHPRALVATPPAKVRLPRFTHICAVTRTNPRLTIRHVIIAFHMPATLRAIRHRLMKRRHAHDLRCRKRSTIWYQAQTSAILCSMNRNDSPGGRIMPAGNCADRRLATMITTSAGPVNIPSRWIASSVLVQCLKSVSSSYVEGLFEPDNRRSGNDPKGRANAENAVVEEPAHKCILNLRFHPVGITLSTSPTLSNHRSTTQ